MSGATAKRKTNRTWLRMCECGCACDYTCVCACVCASAKMHVLWIKTIIMTDYKYAYPFQWFHSRRWRHTAACQTSTRATPHLCQPVRKWHSDFLNQRKKKKKHHLIGGTSAITPFVSFSFERDYPLYLALARKQIYYHIIISIIHIL